MMLRVLILGPTHREGSLPPYLDVLEAGLRRHGAAVTRRGSDQLPYDLERQSFWGLDELFRRARQLAARIDPTDYDVIAVNAGNLEYDQLVPALWPTLRPPLVHHVHTLDPTLLRDHVRDRSLYRQVQDTARGAEGHVFFGRYARKQFADRIPAGRPSTVAWLPTTIPPDTRPNARPELTAALATQRPLLSLYGYASPWKDAALLVAALERMQTPARVVLAGDFWDDPDQAGCDLRAFTGRPVQVGRGELVVVPGYLTPADRLTLVAASAAGVFPYRRHTSFQGSGAIGDYLARSVPVVVTDVANMAELVGPDGRVVAPDQPDDLARALDAAAGDLVGAQAGEASRSASFTAHAHAGACLEVYQRAVNAREHAP